jgi:hypothetical protein
VALHLLDVKHELGALVFPPNLYLCSRATAGPCTHSTNQTTNHVLLPPALAPESPFIFPGCGGVLAELGTR